MAISGVKCLQKGKTVDKRHLYEFDTTNYKGPKRTEDIYTNDLNNAIKNCETNNVVKGPCSLSRLK